MIAAGRRQRLSIFGRPLLARHGVTLWPHYGQTELGGPALIGGLEGSLSAMRPPPGVRYELVDEHGVAASGCEGELVLLGVACATAGYLPGSGGRDLSGGSGAATTERFFTGDVFRECADEEGEMWLHHVCRQDDLLLHSTGEMTNPLPIEAALLAKCVDHVKMLCVFGQKRPTPMLVAQLHEEAYRESAQAALLAALREVNGALAAIEPGLCI